MINSLYLAYRYLWYHKLRNLILTVSLAMIIFMPAGLQKLISESEIRMMDRASSTPLVIGEKGSATDLVINSLYFEKERSTPLPIGKMKELNELGFDTEHMEAVGFGSSKPINTSGTTSGDGENRRVQFTLAPRARP